VSKTLQNWIDSDVASVKDQPVKWRSEHYFFRDPMRPIYSDTSTFFSPADGIILYQKTVHPAETLVEIKGSNYTLQQAMRNASYDRPSLVIGVFMTFYDVHVNRVSYPGRLSYKELEPIHSLNYPMLDVEKGILDDLLIDLEPAEYLHYNQRMLNRVHAPILGETYYILQIADYDVDRITPFGLKQNQPYFQNQRFSQIQYGSQVDLIVPLSNNYDLALIQPAGMHVEAGIDGLIKISEKSS